MGIFKKTWIAFCLLLALVLTGIENQANASVNIMATGVVVTDSSSLNVRQSASGTSPILGTVAKGSTVNILHRVDPFYKIQYKGKIGYVNAAYIKATYKVTSHSAIGFINDKASLINYRVNPEKEAKALGVITTNHKVFITGIVGTWYQIKINNLVAYIPKENVSTNPIYEKLTASATVKSNSVIYKNTNLNSDTLFNVTIGQSISITGQFNDWYRVSHNGQVGYILKSKLELFPTFSNNKSKSFITAYKKVNLYNAPNTAASKTRQGLFVISNFDISGNGKWIRYVDYDKLFSNTVKTYYISTADVAIQNNYGENKTGETNILDVPKYIKINSYQTAYIRMYYETRLIETITGNAIDSLTERAYEEALKKIENYTSEELKEKLLQVRNIPVIRAAETIYTAIDDYDSLVADILLKVEAQLYYHIVKADEGRGIKLNYTYIGLIKSSSSQ